MHFDFMYFVFIAPALLLGFIAQMWIKSAYASADQVPARLSGAAAAQEILRANGLYNVGIEETPGHLSDHYDPRQKVLRLSSNVYHGRSLAAVGIAAHEVGHAIQDARNYAPLVIRNAAVSVASFGSNAAFMFMLIGALINFTPLILLGVILFSAVVFFQLVNLPVEFNASSRAKEQLAALGIVDAREMSYVRKVLSAAALTYVAAALEAVLILLYYIMRMLSSNRSR